MGKSKGKGQKAKLQGKYQKGGMCVGGGGDLLFTIGSGKTGSALGAASRGSLNRFLGCARNDGRRGRSGGDGFWRIGGRGVDIPALTLRACWFRLGD